MQEGGSGGSHIDTHDEIQEGTFSGTGSRKFNRLERKEQLPERSAERKDAFSGSVLQNYKEGSGRR